MAFKLVLITLALLTTCVLFDYTAAASTRVVGGVNANIGQFPHQVSLQRDDGSHTCGASIINERFLLTAAHCVVAGGGIEPFPARYFQARAGSVKYNIGGKLLKIKRIIVNNTYGDFLNDVALLELEKPLVYTEKIKPIELATEEVPTGSDVIISGWGRLYTNGPIPFHLQWNTLKALTTEECEAATDFGRDCLLCLAHEAENGACNGDSGGPAIYQGKLVGIAGFVINGCGSEFPDGYAKVSYHLDWIKANMA